MVKKLHSVSPGLLLCIIIAVPSILFHQYVYKPISPITVAIILGLIINNSIKFPSVYREGIGFSLKRILRCGIILLGIRLSFMDVLKIGGNTLAVIIICIIAATFLVRLIAMKMKLPEKLGTLIGVGTAICGNSAIIATAPVIGAKEEDIACAVTIVTFFGVLAVFVYPIVGHFLRLHEATFGTWAGTAINDTSQVVAASFMYSQRSGEIATVVKLTRTLFMIPLIILLYGISEFHTIRECMKETGFLQYLGVPKRGTSPSFESYERKRVNLLGYIYAKYRGDVQLKGKVQIKKIFPWFLLGFLTMALIRTVNVLPSGIINLLKLLAEYCIVIALAAIGLTTDFKIMKQQCFKRPLGVGLIAASIMGVLSIVIIKILEM